jgi:hypothetical protein
MIRQWLNFKRLGAALLALTTGVGMAHGGHKHGKKKKKKRAVATRHVKQHWGHAGHTRH